MKPWIRNTGLGLLGLVMLAGGALVAGMQLGERKMQRRIELSIAPLAPTLARDAGESIERGRYVFMSRGCTECHGTNGAGKTFVDDGKGMKVHAPNITPGEGHVVATYRDEDWTRTIRHGVKPDGRPAIVMPSEDYARMSDDDLAALVAFLKQMPSLPGERATVQFPPPVMAMYAFGLLRDAAEKIDHTLPPPAAAPDAPTASHGAYLANACIGCHGPGLSGGRIPGAPPDWPAAANLTPGDGSAMKRYASAEQFAAMLRSGKRPDGSAVSPVMPFTALKEFNDVDAKALYLHLTSLEPRKGGER